MFCSASLGADNTEEQTGKLKKLLSLWQSKVNYFDESSIRKLNEPAVAFENFKTDLLHKHGPDLLPITQKFSAIIESYQNQHQNFAAHVTQQILALDCQKKVLEGQQQGHTIPFENGNSNGINIPPPSLIFPDFSKPPPGFPIIDPYTMPPHLIPPENLVPKSKYYDLPAGLMIPLIAVSYLIKMYIISSKSRFFSHTITNINQ